MFLTAGVYAAPERLIETKKEEGSQLTIEEQTARNRAVANRTASTEDEGANDSAKRTRGNMMADVSEASSSSSSSSLEMQSTTSSSSNPAVPTAVPTAVTWESQKQIDQMERACSSRSDEFTSEQQEKITESLQASRDILTDLDAAAAAKNQETINLLKQEQNAHHQIIKALLSTDPKVLRAQKMIIEVNEGLADIACRMIFSKEAQNKMLVIQKMQQSIDCRTKRIERKGLEYTAVFACYQFPISFFEKERALLQEAKKNLLTGKQELSVSQKGLAERWRLLATETATSVNMYSHEPLATLAESAFCHNFPITPQTFLTQEWQTKMALFDQEEKQQQQAILTTSINEQIKCLPWNFDKTFEENMRDGAFVLPKTVL